MTFSANCGDVPLAETRGFSRIQTEKPMVLRAQLFFSPTVFTTLRKVFGGIILCCGLLIGLLSQRESLNTVKFIGSIWLWGFGGFLVIGGLSYVICAILQGGKYCVVFEMDGKSVTYISFVFVL